ncbi:hypothetical protein DM02DRAFT_614779 [Periconia macrospinosa]|uniref:Uncharacterized protein n=1 Tax=Periconia macrospinosa TaxID=97972 RepID=A0A2V1DQT1_9PLEO|nr:hypothetical protein DM02DRAFT_614779 [Periconia macrospinosa]
MHRSYSIWSPTSHFFAVSGFECVGEAASVSSAIRFYNEGDETGVMRSREMCGNQVAI